MGYFPLDIFIHSKSYVDATNVLKEVYKNYLGDMDTYNVSNETILKTRNVYKNIFSQLNKENKNFKISLVEKGKSNRDYFSAYEWLELAHVVYRCHNIKGHVTLPFQEESSGLFRLYLAMHPKYENLVQIFYLISFDISTKFRP